MIKSAGILIFARSTGRCLLLQRPDGHWGTPGGHLEKGETAMEAALAELQEETGFSGHIVLDGGQQTTERYVLFMGEVSQEFQPKLNEEHLDYRWVPTTRLPQPLHYGLQGLL